MTVRLRTATPADLAGVVEVFLGCWRGSYAEVLPAPLVALMSDERARELWQRVLASPEGTVLVAEREGELIGLVRYTCGQAEGYVPSLYVSPLAQGTGVGGRLLEAAADAFRDAGLATAYLWVFAGNQPSIGFYAARGWLPDGGTRVEEEFGEPELRLRKPL